MRLAALLLGLVLAALTLAGSNPDVLAQSGVPVRYSIDPSSASVQPGGTVNIKLSMQTDVNLAGGSVHLGFNNASFAVFESINQSAADPDIQPFVFTSYYEQFDDVLFICQNNSCPPGNYVIGTIVVTAGSSGSATVGFNPKETFDPSLSALQASGAAGTYSITGNAPPSPPKPRQSTFTIPKENSGSSGGGNDNRMEPLQITNEQYVERQRQAQQSVDRSISESDGEESGDGSFWTGRNIAIAGVAISLVSVVSVVVVSKLYSGPKWPKDSGGPAAGAGSGPVVHG